MARRRLSLGWLKPPKVPADGVMSLADHLRELRYRLVLSVVVITLAALASLFIYDAFLVKLLLQPWFFAQSILKVTNPELNIQTTMQGVTSPLFLMIKVCAIAGLIATSPIWLYQLWAYIAPALLAKEKKYALLFLGASVPLFLAGVLVGYWVLPQGIAVMMAFTPDIAGGILNLLDVGDFLNLLVQLMLVFGIGFLLPVVVVTLNLIGVVSAAALKKARPYVVFGSFVFAAAATPGGDPFSMMALGIPMFLLFLLAEFICHLNDKRRAKQSASQGLEVA